MKVAKGKKEITKMIPLGNKAQLWSEFTTAVYKLQVTIDHKGLKETKIYDFGLREFKAKGTRFEVNGTPIFLRGTLNCCEFPLTGYPSMDAAYWAKIYRACKSYGLNHVRFHSCSQSPYLSGKETMDLGKRRFRSCLGSKPHGQRRAVYRTDGWCLY